MISEVVLPAKIRELRSRIRRTIWTARILVAFIHCYLPGRENARALCPNSAFTALNRRIFSSRPMCLKFQLRAHLPPRVWLGQCASCPLETWTAGFAVTLTLPPAQRPPPSLGPCYLR